MSNLGFLDEFEGLAEQEIANREWEESDKVMRDLRRQQLKTDRPFTAGSLDFLRGSSEGLTFGFLDEVLGLFDQKAKEEARETQRRAEERSPVASTAGEIVGSIVSGLAVPMARGVSLLDDVALRGGQAMVEGGLYSLGRSEAPLGSEQMGKDVAQGAALGGVVGAGLPLAGAAVTKVLPKIAGKAAELGSQIPLIGKFSGDPEAAKTYGEMIASPSKYEKAKNIKKTIDVHLKEKIGKEAPERIAEKKDEAGKLYEILDPLQVPAPLLITKQPENKLLRKYVDEAQKLETPTIEQLLNFKRDIQALRKIQSDGSVKNSMTQSDKKIANDVVKQIDEHLKTIEKPVYDAEGTIPIGEVMTGADKSFSKAKDAERAYKTLFATNGKPRPIWDRIANGTATPQEIIMFGETLAKIPNVAKGGAKEVQEVIQKIKEDAAFANTLNKGGDIANLGQAVRLGAGFFTLGPLGAASTAFVGNPKATLELLNFTRKALDLPSVLINKGGDIAAKVNRGTQLTKLKGVKKQIGELRDLKAEKKAVAKQMRKTEDAVERRALVDKDTELERKIVAKTEELKGQGVEGSTTKAMSAKAREDMVNVIEEGEAKIAKVEEGITKGIQGAKEKVPTVAKSTARALASQPKSIEDYEEWTPSVDDFEEWIPPVEEPTVEASIPAPTAQPATQTTPVAKPSSKPIESDYVPFKPTEYVTEDWKEKARKRIEEANAKFGVK